MNILIEEIWFYGRNSFYITDPNKKDVKNICDFSLKFEISTGSAIVIIRPMHGNI